MKKTILIFTLTLLFCIASFGQADTTYTKTLRKFLEVSIPTEMIREYTLGMSLNSLKQSPEYAEVSSDFWDNSSQEIYKSSYKIALDQLSESMNPTYAKLFSTEELQQLTVLFKTSFLHKMTSHVNEIEIKKREAIRQWKTQFINDLHNEIEEKGYY